VKRIGILEDFEHKKRIPAADVQGKTIELRLTAVKEAMHRIRSVFIVMTIASAAILFTLFNASFSRERTVAFPSLQAVPKDLSLIPSYCEKLDATVMKATPQPSPGSAATPESAAASSDNQKNGPGANFGKEELLKEWYHSRSIQVGLLGIHVAVSDLPVIGSMSLVIVTIWFFYAQRRANRTLVSLLRSVDREHRDDFHLRNMIFHEVRNNLLFVKTEESDRPLVGLKGDDTLKGIAKDEPDIVLKDDGVQEKKKSGFMVRALTYLRKLTFTGLILKVLIYLPFLTIVAVMIRDFIALAMYSPTSGKDLSLGKILWYEMRCNLETNPNLGYITAGKSFFMMLGFETFAALCAIYTLYLCLRSSAFSNANRSTLRDFGRPLTLTNPPTVDE
jgi:hypothetical protein